VEVSPENAIKGRTIFAWHWTIYVKEKAKDQAYADEGKKLTIMRKKLLHLLSFLLFPLLLLPLLPLIVLFPLVLPPLLLLFPGLLLIAALVLTGFNGDKPDIKPDPE